MYGSTPAVPMLMLVYSEVNSGWMFMYGDTPQRFYPRGEPAPLIFPTRPAAVRIACQCCWQVDNDNKVHRIRPSSTTWIAVDTETEAVDYLLTHL